MSAPLGKQKIGGDFSAETKLDLVPRGLPLFLFLPLDSTSPLPLSLLPETASPKLPTRYRSLGFKGDGARCLQGSWVAAAKHPWTRTCSSLDLPQAHHEARKFRHRCPPLSPCNICVSCCTSLSVSYHPSCPFVHREPQLKEGARRLKGGEAHLTPHRSQPARAGGHKKLLASPTLQCLSIRNLSP